jgi:hypothetical protein
LVCFTEIESTAAVRLGRAKPHNILQNNIVTPVCRFVKNFIPAFSTREDQRAEWKTRPLSSRLIRLGDGTILLWRSR